MTDDELIRWLSARIVDLAVQVEELRLLLIERGCVVNGKR